MLNPRFFARPYDQPFPDGATYQVLFYAQVQGFTLVRWRWAVAIDLPPDRESPEGEAVEGECLYSGETLLTSSINEYLELGETTEQDERLQHLSPDPRNRIGSNLGNYGLAPAIAAALRSPENQVWSGFFRPETRPDSLGF